MIYITNPKPETLVLDHGRAMPCHNPSNNVVHMAIQAGGVSTFIKRMSFCPSKII
jgi:hypothetical protein